MALGVPNSRARSRRRSAAGSPREHSRASRGRRSDSRATTDAISRPPARCSDHESGYRSSVTRIGVTGQSLDSDLALLRGLGGAAAALLRGGDEDVAGAGLRPALRGTEGAPPRLTSHHPRRALQFPATAVRVRRRRDARAERRAGLRLGTAALSPGGVDEGLPLSVGCGRPSAGFCLASGLDSRRRGQARGSSSL